MGKFALKFGREDLLLSISHSLASQGILKNYDTGPVLNPVKARVIDESGKPTSSRRDFDTNYAKSKSKEFVLIPVTTSEQDEHYNYGISISAEVNKVRSIKTTLDSSLSSMGIVVNYNKGQTSIIVIDINYEGVLSTHLSFIPMDLTSLVINYLKNPFELVNIATPLIPISTQKLSSPLSTPAITEKPKEPSKTIPKVDASQPSKEEDDIPELEDFVAPSTPKTPYILRDKVYGSKYMQVSGSTSDSEEATCTFASAINPMLREKTYSSMYISTASSYYETTDSENDDRTPYEPYCETCSVTGIGRSSDEHHEDAT